MNNLTGWYRGFSEDERFELFGYRSWWHVFGGSADRPSIAEPADGEPPISERPGFFSDDRITVEALCAALHEHQKRLDLWCCVYTAEGWRFVFSNDEDAMVARLLI